MADVGFDRCVIITSTFAAAAALKPPPPRTARGRRSGSVAVAGAVWTTSAAFLL